MISRNFTYGNLKKRCPGCGCELLMAGGYLFCEREHGRGWPDEVAAFPVATRTAKAGRLTIDGLDGFWRVASHKDCELQHDGPPEGSVVAAIKRYGADIPTAVVFVRKGVPRKTF